MTISDMPRVGWISEDWVTNGTHLVPGGCTYYRCLMPSNATPGAPVGKPAFTSAAGFGVRINNQQAVFGLDTVVFKLVMHKWIPKQMRIAQDLGQRIIVDIDDHFDGLHEANQAFHTTDPARNRASNREHLREIIKQADLVTVSTPFLADYYADKARDVRLIRNGVNPRQFTPVKHADGRPIIGWAGATAWRSNDLEGLRSWLPSFLQENEVFFMHAGHESGKPTFAELTGVNPDLIVTVPMQPLPKYADMLAFDIGIVPLAAIDFNRAKSSIKGLEYSLAGIPWVADPMPEYERLTQMGVGRVARSTSEWVEHLTALLDYRTRKREARVNEQLVLKHHTIHDTLPVWRDVLADWDRRVPVRTSIIPYV